MSSALRTPNFGTSYGLRISANRNPVPKTVVKSLQWLKKYSFKTIGYELSVSIGAVVGSVLATARLERRSRVIFNKAVVTVSATDRVVDILEGTA